MTVELCGVFEVALLVKPELAVDFTRPGEPEVTVGLLLVLVDTVVSVVVIV